MWISFVFGLAWMVGAHRYLQVTNGIMLSVHTAAIWFATVGLAVFAGAAEDITHQLRARYRLALTLAASFAAAWMLDLRIERLGIDWLDAMLKGLPWLGLVLALLAVAGLPHAFNLIDGYNGLAGMVGVICSFALAYVCLQVNDRELAAIAVVLAAATAGFLVWNYPRGFIFAGDGGAYLWGTVIAITSISLVQRHPVVSPWFPALLLIYPVWETVFSIYRKAAKGQSPSVADALHFHQLIYRRVVREVFEDDEARRMLMRNNRTSPYLWSFTLLTVIPAVLFWRSTAILIGFSVLFVASYVYAYVAIIRFKVPDWIRR